VIADSRMDIPEAMIETTQQQMLEEFEQRITSQGLSFDQYKMFTGTDEEKMLEQIRPQAELRIKSRLVLEAIVEAEGIQAT
ncbi:MAG: trigger factor, partial [Oscillospiraceae bacterium]|nr:trigger factor [Oscillospiraceae bacterium]